jgi:prophage regulatory protein
MAEVRFLRLREVIARTGRSRSTIYASAAQGKFPKPIKLGVRSVGWVEADVQQWQDERIAASRAEGRVR